MQIHRMLDIVTILLSRERVTAAELAKRFEVSTRTIYRDVEALSQANIPIYADRGRGGGIQLMPGYTLSRSLLTEREQDEVLSALESVRATSAPEAHSALDKLSTLFQRDRASWIAVDFSDWSGSDNRFDQIKAAILGKQRMQFDYFSSYGEKTSRTVEPLQMWFRHRSWYLKAYCLDRQALRLFKYARMRNLTTLSDVFERALPADWNPDVPDGPPSDTILLKIRIAPAQAYRVYDEFSGPQIQPQPDGSFIVTARYIMDSWTLSFILSFGEQAEVLEPGWLRGLIAWRLKTASEQYYTNPNL